MTDDEDGACVHRTVSNSRWRPKAVASSTSFPSAEQLVFDEIFTNYRALLPVSLIVFPDLAHGKGHRVRSRNQVKRCVVSYANQILIALNKLDSGFRNKARTITCSVTPSSHLASSCSLTTAASRLHRRVLKHATLVVTARHSCQLADSDGAQITSSLLKAELTDHHSTLKPVRSQVAMAADAMVGPAPGSPCVNMLEALPVRERELYSHEGCIIDPVGK